MSATFGPEHFSVCYPYPILRYKEYDINNIIFLFFTLGLSHCRRNIGYGCFENVVKRYVDERRKMEQISEEDCISRILPNKILAIKIRRMRWVQYVAHKGEMRDAYRALVGKPEGKRPLGRPRDRG
jgi:hypothetical protein